MGQTIFHFLYKNTAAKWPLLPRVKRSFWGLLMFSVLFILIGYFDFSNTSISVQPVSWKKYGHSIVAVQQKDTVFLAGELVIDHPTVPQKLLLTNTKVGIDFLTLLLFIVISIIVIRMTPRLQQEQLFRKDISGSLRLIGFVLFAHVILSYWRLSMYIPAQVESITHGEFSSAMHFPMLLFAEGYAALLIIVFGSAYKKGIQLQQEQDLTI